MGGLNSVRMSSCYVSTATVVVLVLTLCTLPCSGRRPRPARVTGTEFIRRSCLAAEYPDLCFSSLSAYAASIRRSPLRLARAALNVSLLAAVSAADAAQRASAAGAARTAREAAAVSDCMENIGDSVDELQRSLEEMGRLGGQNTGMEMGDVQTWVSAALTEMNTCSDGLEACGDVGRGGSGEGAAAAAVDRRVKNLVQLTVNALALVNALVAAP